MQILVESVSMKVGFKMAVEKIKTHGGMSVWRLQKCIHSNII